MKLFYILFILLSTNLYAQNDLFQNNFSKDYSLYFLGVVKHGKPTKKTHEGNMEYLAISKWNRYNLFNIESGIGTYIDSYSLRAYTFFNNISYEKYNFWIFEPMIGTIIQYKGIKYDSNKRKPMITPSLKLRVGKKDGFFLNIMVVPKIKKLTNGFYTFEVGYRL